MVTKALLRSRDTVLGPDKARAEEAAVATRHSLDVVARLPYGTFVDCRTAAVDIAALQRDGMWVKTFQDPHVLELTGYTLDAVAKGIRPDHPPALMLTPDEAEAWRDRVVFLDVPVHPDLVRRVESTGARVLEALSSFALLVHGTVKQWDKIAADAALQDRVLWAVPFAPAYRLAKPISRAVDHLLGAPGLGVGDPEFQRNAAVVVRKGRGVRGLARVLAIIRNSAGVVLEAAEPGHGQRPYHRVVCVVRLDAILEIARDPAVRWIDRAPERLRPDDERSAQIVARNFVPGSDPAQPRRGYEMLLGWLGVDGSDVRVAICDTGVFAEHPSLSPGFVGEINYGSETLTDREGHGTHVAGIAVGRATTQDEEHFYPGLGVAPGAEFVSLKALAKDSRLYLPDGYELGLWSQLTADAYRQGARVMNNSWSTDPDEPDVGYSQTCAAFDELVRHADPADPDGGQSTIVFSAGNRGDLGASSLTAPKALKNAIVVGATYGGRTPGAEYTDLRERSSRGRTEDTRVVPIVVAPGAGIASARSGECDGDRDSTCTGDAVRTLDAEGLAASQIDRFVVASGTSMAAPHVSGVCALLIQRWRQAFAGDGDGPPPDPSPAMLKALLVNSATDIHGGRMNEDDGVVGFVPSADQGWGLVDLRRALCDSAEDFLTSRVLVDDDGTTFDESGRFVTYSIEVVDRRKPLRVTLAWTDLPGPTGAGPALVNDLDLEVAESDAPATAIYKGNRRFVHGFSQLAADASHDRVDNVECVYVEEPQERYEIRVTAHVLKESARQPGDLATTWQDFALVVDNASLV